MTEHDNELARASAENGTFDPEKAKRAAADAVSQFSARLKKVERLMLAYLVGCVAVMAFAAVQLWFASSVKAMVFFSLVFLIAFETTILMKLWYWVVNGKLATLKELKQWQLRATMPFGAAASPWTVDASEAETSFRHPGLSHWERCLWFGAILIIGCIAGGYIGIHNRVRSMTVNESIALKADGSATDTYRESYQAPYILSTFPMTTSAPDKIVSIRWLDENGRELAYDISNENGQRNYTVHFAEPIMPGEWVRYTRIIEDRSRAIKEGDLWTYMGGCTHVGFRHNQFHATVEMPRGAIIVSVEPKPLERWIDNGVERLTFQASQGQDERFEFHYKVQYRLEGETKSGEKKPSSSG